MDVKRNESQHFARPRPSCAIAVAFSLLTLALTLSGPLSTQAYAVPSVVDQYTEQVPSAGGGGATDTGSGTTKPDDVSAGDQDGVATDLPAEDNDEAATPGDDPGASAQGMDPQGESKAPAGAPADSSADTTEANGLTASDDDSGMGLALPIGMVLVAAAVTAVVIFRRRAGAP